MPSTLLYLVRHAEQAPGGGLTDLGERQARALGGRLRGVPLAAVSHSPLRRAASTAEQLAEFLPGVPVRVSEHLRDRTPVPPPDRADLVPRRLLPWFAQVPAAERDPDGVAVTAAVGHFGAVGGTDRRELLVTHAFVLGWFVRQALDAPWSRWIDLQPLHAAVTVIRYESDHPPALLTFNDTGHLPPELCPDSPFDPAT